MGDRRSWVGLRVVGLRRTIEGTLRTLSNVLPVILDASAGELDAAEIVQIGLGDFVVGEEGLLSSLSTTRAAGEVHVST